MKYEFIDRGLCRAPIIKVTTQPKQKYSSLRLSRAGVFCKKCKHRTYRTVHVLWPLNWEYRRGHYLGDTIHGKPSHTPCPKCGGKMVFLYVT